MKSHILQPGDQIIVDGVKLSYEEIIESKIDSILYRKHLKKLMNEAEA